MLKEKNEIINSYIALRRVIGISGMMLPFVCVAGGALISGICTQESISFYYYSNMRDFFVGLMAVVSMFLITYKGYSRLDDAVTTSSGVMGLGLTLFPCMFSAGSADRVGIFLLRQELSDTIHVTCAGLFFILLALNSIFLFTRSSHKKSEFTFKKKIRNIIYISCGIIMLVSLLLLLVLTLVLGKEAIDQYKIPLVLEIVMLLAFGISWLIKGETLLRDLPEDSAS